MFFQFFASKNLNLYFYATILHLEYWEAQPEGGQQKP